MKPSDRINEIIYDNKPRNQLTNKGDASMQIRMHEEKPTWYEWAILEYLNEQAQEKGKQ